MPRFIARWNDESGSAYVELFQDGTRYYCNTTCGILGPRRLDDHTFENDDEAIWYVDKQVREGSFDPPPLVWKRSWPWSSP